MPAAPARLALLLFVFALPALLPGCGIPPDHRTVQQAVEDAVEGER
jgi:hypothetical protein